MNTNTASQDTINNALIEMLRGAKSVGAEIYDVSKAGVVKAIDFAMENATPLVNEFLTWHFTRSAALAVVLIIPSIVLFYIVYRLIKALRNSEVDFDFVPPFTFLTFLCLVPAILLFCGSFDYMMDCIQIKTAPRIYMIEWIASQIKK